MMKNALLLFCALFVVGASPSSAARGKVVSASVHPAAPAYDVSSVDPASAALARQYGSAALIIKKAAARNLGAKDFPKFFATEARAVATDFEDYFKAIDAASKSPQAALKEYSVALAAHPGSPRQLVFRGMAQEQLGNQKAASDDYTAAIKLDRYGFSGLAFYLRGLVRKDLGDSPGAQADLEKAQELLPSYAPVYYASASVYLEKGAFFQSARDLDKFFELNTDTAAAAEVSASIECEELLALGFGIRQCRESMGGGAGRTAGSSYDDLRIWERAQSLREKTEINAYVVDAQSAVISSAARSGVVSPEDKAALLCAAAQSAGSHFTGEKSPLGYGAALKLYDLAAFINPSAPVYMWRGTALLHLARAYEEEEAYAEAEQDFSRVLEGSSGSFKGWALKLRAEARVGLGKYPLAIEDCGLAIAADASNPWFYQTRAFLFVNEGRLNEAAADMEKFFSLEKGKFSLEQESRGPACKALSSRETPVSGCESAAYFAKNAALPRNIVYPSPSLLK